MRVEPVAIESRERVLDMGETVLTTHKACERLDVKDPRTVIGMIREGKLRGCKVNRRWRVFEDSIDELLGLPRPPSRNSERARAAMGRLDAWQPPQRGGS